MSKLLEKALTLNTLNNPTVGKSVIRTQPQPSQGSKSKPDLPSLKEMID